MKLRVEGVEETISVARVWELKSLGMPDLLVLGVSLGENSARG